MLLRLIMVFTLVFPVGISSAAEVKCAIPKILVPYNVESCVCGEKMPSPSRNTSRFFPLAAVCNYYKDNGWDYGIYYFSGSHVISGTIILQESNEYSEHFTFRPDEKSKKLLPAGFDWLYFANPEKVHRSLGTPKITKANDCWKAAAVIRIDGIADEIDFGTDFKIQDLTVFRSVVSVDKFSKCEKQPGL